jgi:hypothetical protein
MHSYAVSLHLVYCQATLLLHLETRSRYISLVAIALAIALAAMLELRIPEVRQVYLHGEASTTSIMIGISTRGRNS